VKNNTKIIALGGILTGICQILLYLIAVLPTSKLAFYSFISFTVAVIIIEAGVRYALIYYIANVVLAFIIVPDKIVIIPYIVFFGVYGVLKLYIEKLNKRALELIIKYIYFNICVLLGYIFIKEFMLESINIKNLPLAGFILLLEVIFFIFDYVYTLLIGYYNEKLRKYIRFTGE
jgi:hypothetical protein